MPKLNELPSIAQANEEDLVLLQQGGGDKQATRGQLLADRVRSVDSIADLPATGTNGQKVSVSGYHAGTTVGGGDFVGGTGVHNGRTIIDPSRTFPTPAQWANGSSDPAVIAWFDTHGGTVDVWIKTSEESPKHDIFIIYGQSNSIGYAGQPSNPAQDDSATPTPLPRCYNYDPVTDAIVTIDNRMNHLNYDLEGGGSRGNAWTAFANRWQQQTGRGVIVVSCGRGGAPISALEKGNTTPVYSDPVERADYYQAMLDGYAATKAAAVETVDELGDTYFLFHQGETDQTNGTSYVTYRNALNGILTDVFTDIPELNKAGVFIVGCPGSRNQFDWQRIQSAQYAAVSYGAGAGITENACIVYDGCPTFRLGGGQYNPQDNTHYSQRGYNQMGDGAALNLFQFAKNPNFPSSKIDETARQFVRGAGYLGVQLVSGIGSYSAGWKLLRKENTNASDAYYPCYIQSLAAVGDDLQFIMNGKAPVTYSMSAEVNSVLDSSGVRASVSKFTASDNWGFNVSFYADFHFAVDISTGALLFGNPLGADGGIVAGLISVSTTGTTATVTHPAIKQAPETFYSSTSGAEAGYVGMRATSGTTFDIETSGPSNVVNVVLRNMPMPVGSIIQLVGSPAVRLTAFVSDDV